MLPGCPLTCPKPSHPPGLCLEIASAVPAGWQQVSCMEETSWPCTQRVCMWVSRQATSLALCSANKSAQLTRNPAAPLRNTFVSYCCICKRRGRLWVSWRSTVQECLPNSVAHLRVEIVAGNRYPSRPRPPRRPLTCLAAAWLGSLSLLFALRYFSWVKGWVGGNSNLNQVPRQQHVSSLLTVWVFLMGCALG